MLKQKKIFLGVLMLFIVSMMSCNNKFETLRMSTDVDLKMKKAFEFYANKEYQKAQYLLEDLIGNVRGTKDAEKVYFHYAYTHYYLQNYTFASYYFKQFSSTFPYGQYAEEALYMSADAFYRLSPNYRLTQEDTKNAVEGLQTFVNTYPNSGKVDSCNALIDNLRAKLEKKDLEAAKGYFHRKHYKAAKHIFTSLLVTYPDTKQAEYIRHMVIKSSYRYAQESVLSKQVERYEETLGYIDQFQDRYPDSKYKREIESINAVAKSKIKKIRNEL